MNQLARISGGEQARHGFSLTEMLVVLAIMAVLAAILLPSLVRQQSAAAAAKCVGNLRSISAGLMAYAAENDGKLIPSAARGSTGLNGAGLNWYRVLEPYMGHPQRSLDAPADLPWQQCPGKRFPVVNNLTVGYGWNFMNFGHDVLNSATWGRGENSRLSQVAQPARTIIIGDSQDEILPGQDFVHRYIYEGVTRMPRRHSGRGNFLFLDGHVQALTPEEVSANNFYLFKKVKP
jgi:prepilin-type N-terminal cleavage/methylation domain-containing protein/prepilin-type processing-associated H-X9-DG protein